MNNNIIQEYHQNIAFIGIKRKTQSGELNISIRGSGFILGDSQFVTNAHIIDQIPKDFISSLFCGVYKKSDQNDKIAEYTPFSLKIDKKNVEKDIAILDIVDSKYSPGEKKIGESNLLTEAEIGDLGFADDLYFAGFPLANDFIRMNMGITLIASKCVVGNKKYDKNGKIDFLLIDKIVNPGNSGSPIFFQNKILGIVSGTIDRINKNKDENIKIPSGIGIVRTSNYILDLLE